MAQAFSIWFPWHLSCTYVRAWDEKGKETYWRVLAVHAPQQLILILLFYRCSYLYDALGNLYRKNCSDSTTFQYLVDPFGVFGADIIAEV